MCQISEDSDVENNCFLACLISHLIDYDRRSCNMTLLTNFNWGADTNTQLILSSAIFYTFLKCSIFLPYRPESIMLLWINLGYVITSTHNATHFWWQMSFFKKKLLMKLLGTIAAFSMHVIWIQVMIIRPFKSFKTQTEANNSVTYSNLHKAKRVSYREVSQCTCLRLSSNLYSGWLHSVLQRNWASSNSASLLFHCPSNALHSHRQVGTAHLYHIEINYIYRHPKWPKKKRAGLAKKNQSEQSYSKVRLQTWDNGVNTRAIDQGLPLWTGAAGPAWIEQAHKIAGHP